MKTVIMAIFLSGLLAVSCTKKKNDIVATPDPPAGRRIAQMIETYADNTKKTETLTYDAKGRPAVYTTNSRKEVFDFQSASRLLVTSYKLPENTLERTIECTLNDKGAITEMRFKNTSDVITYTYQYAYNAEGYTTWVKGSGSSNDWYEIVPEIKDGNYIRAKETFSSGAVYDDAYTYGSASNTLYKSYFGYWPVDGLFGKPSKNLLLEAKGFKSNGDLNSHIKRNYTITAEGFVNKYIINYMLSGESSVVEITYE
ncbi:MAG: hypothetical protein J7599_00575 [Niabella sp.]|nr:hypothetical protein [Niabella sp.]